MPLPASHQIAVSTACATDDQGRHERSPPDLPASGQPNVLLRDMAARISSARQRQLIRLHAVALERAARSVSTLAPRQVQIWPDRQARVQSGSPANLPIKFPNVNRVTAGRQNHELLCHSVAMEQELGERSHEREPHIQKSVGYHLWIGDFDLRCKNSRRRRTRKTTHLLEHNRWFALWQRQHKPMQSAGWPATDH